MFEGEDIDTSGMLPFDRVAVDRLLTRKATSVEVCEDDRDAAIVIMLRAGITVHGVSSRICTGAETVRGAARRDQERQRRLRERLIIPEVPADLRWAA